MRTWRLVFLAATLTGCGARPTGRALPTAATTPPVVVAPKPIDTWGDFIAAWATRVDARQGSREARALFDEVISILCESTILEA